MTRRALTATVAAIAAVATPALAAGPLFPQPFLIEHQLVHIEPDGTELAAPPVVDHYGGSWIVSVRHDGGRTILDLDRRELMVVDPERQTYSILSFDRWAELSRRLRAADTPSKDAAPPSRDARPGDGGPVVRVQRLADHPQVPNGESPDVKAAAAPWGAPLERFRVVAVADDEEEEISVLDAWFDSRVRLAPAAVDALEALESSLAGEPAGGASVPAMIAAARRAAGGAVVVRTLRPAAPAADWSSGAAIDDVPLRFEVRSTLPQELVEVPEGFVRVPHVLEATVAFAEEDAELRRLMTAVEE